MGLVSPSESPTLPWLSRDAVRLATDGKEPGRGTCCGSAPPCISPAAALSPRWSHVMGHAVPAWGLWGNESAQKPKGQTSLACGDWHGGATGASLQSYLKAAFGRQNSVMPPSVVCRGHARPCCLCHGRGKDTARGRGVAGKALESQASWGNGKGRSSSAVSGACCHFLLLPASSFSSRSSSQTILVEKKPDGGAPAFVSPPAAASFMCSYSCIHTHTHRAMYTARYCWLSPAQPITQQDQGRDVLMPY